MNIQNFKTHFTGQPDFYIKTFQQHKAEHPFVMQPHSHDFYMLMLVTKGTGTHTIELKEYTVKQGSVFFMAPSEAHSWKLSDETQGYILFFNTHFYLMNSKGGNVFDLPLYNPVNKVHAGTLTKKQLPEFIHLMETIKNENIQTSVYQKKILRSYLDIIIQKLALALNINIKSNTAYSTAIIPRLEQLIDKNFIHHSPATFYAEELNMSLQRLNSLTKKTLNKTVADLIQDRMLSEAKRLLAYSTHTISEIAYYLNFNDNAYFTRFFKKSTTLTPEQYRKQIYTTDL